MSNGFRPPPIIGGGQIIRPTEQFISPIDKASSFLELAKDRLMKEEIVGLQRMKLLMDEYDLPIDELEGAMKKIAPTYSALAQQQKNNSLLDMAGSLVSGIGYGEGQWAPGKNIANFFSKESVDKRREDRLNRYNDAATGVGLTPTVVADTTSRDRRKEYNAKVEATRAAMIANNQKNKEDNASINTANTTPTVPEAPAFDINTFMYNPGTTTSNEIAELQKTLGFTGGDVDGVWGPKTKAALDSYKGIKGPVPGTNESIETTPDTSETIKTTTTNVNPEENWDDPEVQQKYLDEWNKYNTMGTGQNQSIYKNQKGSYVPGNRTGDKNPALLEDGEYVLNRNAVKALGKGFLDYVNHEKYPRFQSGGFNTGYNIGSDESDLMSSGFVPGQYGSGGQPYIPSSGKTDDSDNMSGFDLGKGLAAITMNLMNKNQNGTSNNIGNEFGTGVDEFGFGFSSEAAAANQVSPSSGSSGGIGGLEGLFRSWTPPVQFGMQEGGSIGDMNLNQIAEIYGYQTGGEVDEDIKMYSGFIPREEQIMAQRQRDIQDVYGETDIDIYKAQKELDDFKKMKESQLRDKQDSFLGNVLYGIQELPLGWIEKAGMYAGKKLGSIPEGAESWYDVWEEESKERIAGKEGQLMNPLKDRFLERTEGKPYAFSASKDAFPELQVPKTNPAKQYSNDALMELLRETEAIKRTQEGSPLDLLQMFGDAENVPQDLRRIYGTHRLNP